MTKIVEFPPMNINKRTTIGKMDWKEALKKFAESLMDFQSNSSLDKISARGWCYLIETAGFISKDQFDLCQDVINECRDKGILPIDFVALDDSRRFYYVDDIEYRTPVKYLTKRLGYSQRFWRYKEDFEFWESQEYYIQCMVEKIDVLNLYKPICEKYHIPICNAKGWSDKNSKMVIIPKIQILGVQRKKTYSVVCS